MIKDQDNHNASWIAPLQLQSHLSSKVTTPISKTKLAINAIEVALNANLCNLNAKFVSLSQWKSLTPLVVNASLIIKCKQFQAEKRLELLLMIFNGHPQL